MPKRLQRVFTQEEIEAGVLKELLVETDYDIVTAVSTYLSRMSKILYKMLSKRCIFVSICVHHLIT